MLDLKDRQAIAMALVPIIEAAGRVTLRARQHGQKTRQKADGSPVTEADTRSEAHILAGLSRECPDIPVLSEESQGLFDSAALGSRFFLVDPLDGTKEFIAGRDEFTINIALVEDGRPTLGLLLAPALDRLFLSFGSGRVLCREGADGALRPLARRPGRQVPIVLVSRSHLDLATSEGLRALGAHDVRPMGSALKFALLATGEADLYPRCGRTMTWDVAAGQAVLEAAGGGVVGRKGDPIRYDPLIRLDNPPFIAARSVDLARSALRAFRLAE